MNHYFLRKIEDCRNEEEQERQNLLQRRYDNDEGRAAALTRLQQDQKDWREDVPKPGRTNINNFCKHLAPRPRSTASEDFVIQAYCDVCGVNNDNQVPKPNIPENVNLVRILSLASEQYINH